MRRSRRIHPKPRSTSSSRSSGPLYQAVAARVIALANAGQTAEAVVLYNTDSRRPFDLSSDILTRLTDQTVVKAREDSERAASTYAHARTMIVTAMVLAASLLFGVIIYITRGILSPLLEACDLHA